MTPVVDIIGAVVTSMKPTISASAAILVGTTVTVNDLSKSVTDKLFVGQRMKCTFSTSVIYGVIATISDTVITITIDTSSKVAPTAISVVLNYHYGHLLEIKNIFQQATAKASLKLEQFPAIKKWKQNYNNLKCSLSQYLLNLNTGFHKLLQCLLLY